MRVMPGMMNNMCRGGDVARNGAKLRIALAAKIMRKGSAGRGAAHAGRAVRRGKLPPASRQDWCRSCGCAAPQALPAAPYLSRRKPAAGTSRQKPAPAARDENAPPRRHRYKHAGGVGTHPGDRDGRPLRPARTARAAAGWQKTSQYARPANKPISQ
ncbi:Uncharacterised protein [Raoultella ornithinolytica]|nr:Uncharacterised protein [Raoultella ornithinolytica]